MRTVPARCRPVRTKRAVTQGYARGSVETVVPDRDDAPVAHRARRARPGPGLDRHSRIVALAKRPTVKRTRRRLRGATRGAWWSACPLPGAINRARGAVSASDHETELLSVRSLSDIEPRTSAFQDRRLMALSLFDEQIVGFLPISYPVKQKRQRSVDRPRQVRPS